MAAPASKSVKAPSSSLPIEAFDDAFARIYTHVHPMLLLGVFYMQFTSLVRDPIEALPRIALAVAGLQTVYICVCLPSSNHSQLPPRAKHGQKKKTATGPGDTGIGAKLVPAILSLILSVTLGAPVLAFALILFGAPLTTHQIHTVLCGLHISLLAALPLFYVHGVDASKWMEVAALAAPVDEVFGAALGTLVGAWVGAVPIPLDWDRDWQKWPTTILAGAYVGFVVGKLLGRLLRGYKIKLA
ncbi:hypothetical protein MBLNU459_g0978t2 [Dothideomycetes sp. NU459]